MKPEPARFTKSEPCTKLEIWKAFRTRRGFAAVQIDAAHAIIGLNAPRYLKREGYLVKVDRGDKEMYVLTEDGKDWLLNGMLNFIIRHPERREEAKSLPSDWG